MPIRSLTFEHVGELWEKADGQTPSGLVARAALVSRIFEIAHRELASQHNSQKPEAASNHQWLSKSGKSPAWLQTPWNRLFSQLPLSSATTTTNLTQAQALPFSESLFSRFSLDRADKSLDTLPLAILARIDPNTTWYLTSIKVVIALDKVELAERLFVSAGFPQQLYWTLETHEEGWIREGNNVQWIARAFFLHNCKEFNLRLYGEEGANPHVLTPITIEKSAPVHDW